MGSGTGYHIGCPVSSLSAVGSVIFLITFSSPLDNVYSIEYTIADFYDTHILRYSDTASSKMLQAQAFGDNVPLRPFGETQDALKQNVFADAEDRAEIERLGGNAR